MHLLALRYKKLRLCLILNNLIKPIVLRNMLREDLLVVAAITKEVVVATLSAERHILSVLGGLRVIIVIVIGGLLRHRNETKAGTGIVRFLTRLKVIKVGEHLVKGHLLSLNLVLSIELVMAILKGEKKEASVD